jgi:hypothetical protein
MIAGHKKHIIGGETISSRDSSVKLNFSERERKAIQEREIYILLVCDFHFHLMCGSQWWLLSCSFWRKKVIAE